MTSTQSLHAKWNKLAIGTVVVLVTLAVGTATTLSMASRSELIKATARGTGTQQGQSFRITLNVQASSTAEDLNSLSQAYQASQNKGLMDALAKMKSKGDYSIDGRPGYPVAYIQVTPTPAGRKIQFLTDRRIGFREAYYDRQTKDFGLIAGELNLNDKDKAQSTGFLYEDAKVIVDKQGQLKFELAADPWKLVNFVDFGSLSPEPR